MTRDECEKRFHCIRTSENRLEIEKNLRALLEALPILSFAMGRGTTFWRARTMPSQPFDYAHEMSYPPLEVTGVGRLNNPGQPCLYAASRISTALAELQPKAGDKIQILGFKIRADEVLRLGVIGELFHVSKAGYLRSLGHDPDNVLSRLLNSIEPEKSKTMLFIDAFLAHLLADPKAKAKQYLPTRILSELAYEYSGADGFFYPSVQDSFGINLSILPKPFDTHTHPICCKCIRLDAVREFGIFDWTVLSEAQGINSEGRFEWAKDVLQDKTTVFGQTKQEHGFISSRPLDDPNILLDLAKLHTR